MLLGITVFVLFISVMGFCQPKRTDCASRVLDLILGLLLGSDLSGHSQYYGRQEGSQVV